MKFHDNLNKLTLIKVLVFSIISVITLLAIVFYNSIFTKATSLDSDFEVKVFEVLAFSLTNCDSTNSSVLRLDITPNKSGVFKSNCQTTTIHTNAPGYSLTAKATGSNPSYNNGVITNNLLYQNPNTLDGLPIVASTISTTSNPTTLDNNTWGFAVEGLNMTTAPTNEATILHNFDTTYLENNSSNKYAQLPTIDTTIYKTTSFPIPQTDHTFYYASKLTTDTVAGTYATTITYTAIGEPVTPAPMSCVRSGKAPECIAFTIDLTTAQDGTYLIPTSGMVTGMTSTHTYDWDVYVDGYLTTDCTDGNCVGTGSTSSNGITLTNLSNNQHQILIVPHTEAIPGWGNAFGYAFDWAEGAANADINRDKLVSVDAPLTTMAFMPKTTESTTNASHMFAFTFNSCNKLTTAVTIIDTYKLPNTITNLEAFFLATHSENTNLTNAIDFGPLKDWTNNNNSITNLSGFLASIYTGNTQLLEPIDLSPFQNWFNSNNSITSLNSFLSGVHHGNTSLTSPFDLTPITNWFYRNESITDLGYFIGAAYFDSPNLASPIDLSPLQNWFNDNNTIEVLSHFLYHTYYNANLVSPADLSPLQNWFNNNNSITNLQGFLNSVHYDNASLTSPIDLSPIRNWFNNNTSINDLSGFVSGAHSYNTNLLEPINLTELSNWFAPNRVVTTITGGFLAGTHRENTSLSLTGQIILPNWIKTMTNSSGTAVWNTGTATDLSEALTVYSFYATFYLAANKSGDTGEVKFEDGTVLSSLGSPSSVNRLTYTRRTGITPLSSYWK